MNGRLTISSVLSISFFFFFPRFCPLELLTLFTPTKTAHVPFIRVPVDLTSPCSVRASRLCTLHSDANPSHFKAHLSLSRKAWQQIEKAQLSVAAWQEEKHSQKSLWQIDRIFDQGVHVAHFSWMELGHTGLLSLQEMRNPSQRWWFLFLAQSRCKSPNGTNWGLVGKSLDLRLKIEHLYQLLCPSFLKW